MGQKKACKVSSFQRFKRLSKSDTWGGGKGVLFRQFRDAFVKGFHCSLISMEVWPIELLRKVVF